MKQLYWDTPEKLRDLLLELVSWQSMTLSAGEREFPIKLMRKFQNLEYYQNNPDLLKLHDVKQGRSFLTVLYKHPEAQDTVVLLSHFDTVSSEEYGELEPYAYQPEVLTELFRTRMDEFSEEVRRDLESGEYLFGRGTMDMKMGIALHMRLIEKATVEKWPLNLLLLTVPDEEVNSEGMRSAVTKLLELKEEYKLDYNLFLNGEPVFIKVPGEHRYNIYSGSMGKIMPSALFFGKETHVGEPLRGMTANYMASFLTQRMEWNKSFQETEMGETTPLPVNLQQKDLKMEYSVQTPYRAAALYNVILLKRTAAEIMDIFEKVAEDAARACNQAYINICEDQGVQPIGTVQVLRYEQLVKYAVEKYGQEFVEEVKGKIHANQDLDDREKSLRLADTLMIQCQELAPAVVLLFAPPYYPPVNSSDNGLVKKCVDYLQEQGPKKYNLSVHQVHYFNGICDLSYVNYQGNGGGWNDFILNTPVWSDSYSIPFAEMTMLQAPVLNVGPFGKDAHKRTERLHINNAFEEVPHLVEGMIKMMINGKNEN